MGSVPQVSAPNPWDRMWDPRRLSLRARWAMLRAKAWHVGQASVAAGVAWWFATQVVGHPHPFFAPVVAVVSLGTSYGQRLRRVAEVTAGVAIGIFLADLLVLVVGSGAWQLTVIVALAMSVTLLVNAGPLLVTQAAVQSIVVVALAASPGYALTRWIDALVGGGVAVLAAAVVPRAPLRRPREQAAVVVRRIAQLLRAAAESSLDGDVERSVEVLRAARSTEPLIRELQAAADEGLSVIASSPFRRGHTGQMRQMAELVEPLDRALRNTRVLVRRVAVAGYRNERLPRAYALLCEDLAQATERIADALARGEMATGVRPALLALGEGTAQVERIADLSAEVVLAQIRSIIVDLLQITGLGVREATDALPPPRK
jgi:uncharacterized membrane protein YgaE (UPF0421/DUF939 family)